MGVRILQGSDDNSTHTTAVLYCSTTDWAFGPLFSSDDEHDAFERADMFLKWFSKNGNVGPLHYDDVRQLTDSELESAYSDWLRQEAEQWKATEQQETE